MKESELLASIGRINDRLKSDDIPFRVRHKGKAIYLRGMYPAKPGDGIGRKRYDLPMGPSSVVSLKKAARQATAIHEAITEKSFDWGNYITLARSNEQKTVREWVQEFKTYYMNRPGKQKNPTEETWKATWEATFKKLPQDEPLRDSFLLAVVLSTKEDSRSREQACQQLQRLAEFAGIAIDLSGYAGNYEPQPRDIPDDELIVEWRDHILNPSWRWAYGMMATFGLRPHEIFACDIIDPFTVRVHRDTKTGERTTRAIMPEWSERWNLVDDSQRPHTMVKTLKARGNYACKQFTRYRLPLTPYDLRHAWAIRASVTQGLSVSTAAKMMGHSVAAYSDLSQMAV
jgi:integrase